MAKLLFILAAFFAFLSDAFSDKAQKIRVGKTFDNKPFEYTIKKIKKNGKFDLYRLTYPSPMQTEDKKNNKIIASYYLPNDIKKDSPPRPGVVCLHILGGDRSLTHLVCSYLADNGIPAVMFLLPHYGERRAKGWHIKNIHKKQNPDKVLLDMFRQGILDTRRTVDVLASRPEINKSKIGLEGISLGAIIGAKVAAEDKRLNKLALLLGGGDIKSLIGKSKESKFIEDIAKKFPPEKQKKFYKDLQEIDPLYGAGKLKDKASQNKVLMINADDDKVMLPACSKKLAKAMGMGNKIIWLKGLGHYTAIAALPQMLDKLTVFFKDGENFGSNSAEPENKTPLVKKFLGEFGKLLQLNPQPGHCIFIDANIAITSRNGKKYNGKLQFAKGNGNKFALKASAPKIPDLNMGYCEYPWLIAENGMAYKGTLKADKKLSPTNYISPKVPFFLQMAVGLCNMALITSPAALESFMKIEEKALPDGKKKLFIYTKKKKEKLTVSVNQKTGIPERIRFDIKGNKGEISFNQWATNATAQPELFIERGTKTMEVEQESLDRIFAAFINHGLEMAR